MALLLRESEVAAALEMDSVIDAVAAATLQLGAGEAQNQPRRRVHPPGGVLSVMSASLPAAGVTGLKCYTVSGGRARFLVTLFGLDGVPQAVIEADLMGAFRTGAATAVAVRHLAPRARRVAVIGAGHQARTQVHALSRVLAIEHLAVFSRDAARRRAFAEEVRRVHGIDTHPAGSAAEAADGAEVVVTITSSPKPVLAAEDVGRGALVVGAGCNLPGRSELPPALVARCHPVIVDQLETARLESGDLLVAEAAGKFDWTSAVGLGEVLAAPADLRSASGPGDLTLFESHGLAVWDLAAGMTVLARAREMGLGEEIRLLD